MLQSVLITVSKGGPKGQRGQKRSLLGSSNIKGDIFAQPGRSPFLTSPIQKQSGDSG